MFSLFKLIALVQFYCTNHINFMGYDVIKLNWLLWQLDSIVQCTWLIILILSVQQNCINTIELNELKTKQGLQCVHSIPAYGNHTHWSSVVFSKLISMDSQGTLLLSPPDDYVQDWTGSLRKRHNK